MLRKMGTSLLLACILFSAFAGIYRATAIGGEANVYIIQLSGVSGWWVNDTAAVKNGALAACMLKGGQIQYNVPLVHPKVNVDYPPYFNAIPKVVTTWSEYESIIENMIGAIVVNTHGEFLPVPSDHTREDWVDEIAEAMLTRRLTWVHCGGYTFYRVWKQSIGDQGEWADNVNGVTIGAGFSRLMNFTNLVNANLWPPSGADQDPSVRAEANTYGEVFQNWRPNLGSCEGRIGRPLKYDDFSQYVTMGIYKVYTDPTTGISYFPGAVISFCNVSKRYTENNGGGAYVHMGLGDFYDSDNETWVDANYVRGFIGTAAAICSESMGFGGKATSVQKIGSGGGLYPVNATYCVMPSISDYHLDSTSEILRVRMIFGTYGVTESRASPRASPWNGVWFMTDALSGDWSDVTMKVDLETSREAGSSGLRISGLQNPQDGSGFWNLMASGTTWYLGAPELLEGIGAWTVYGLGGVILFAQWIQQGFTVNSSGLGTFAPYIAFRNEPGLIWTYMSDLAYCEISSFIAVELNIPVAGHAGWCTLPLSYQVCASVDWTNDGKLLPLIWVNDTLNLAICFSGNNGQMDAGQDGDAGPNTQETQREITAPKNYRGYLGADDTEDLYAFNVNATGHVTIDFSMIPPPYVDFALKLYDPNNNPVGFCDNGPGSTDYLLNYTEISGYWKVQVYSVTGSGVYACSLSIRTSDIDRNGLVNILDAIILSQAYGSSMTSTNWNKAADLNGDNTINILDAIILSNHWGQSMGGGGKSAGSGGSKGGLATAGGGVALDGGTSVFPDPGQVTVFKGEVFNVNVNVASATDLSGWEFKLYWNNTLLNCTNYAIQTPTEWQGNAQNYSTSLNAGYNATHAQLWLAQAANYPAPSFNGSMTIAALTFQALQAGTTSLTLSDVILGNSTAQPIDCTTSSGSVNVYYGRYMRSDTQQVNGLSAYKLGIPQSSSPASYTQSGSGVGASFGIRAWVRHSNGVEQEISLDAQTGTPKAIVGGGSGAIRSSTVSVAQTALQSTDSLVVRVYVEIAEGLWNLCATFTTEQLQSSTIKATTWTVYYYTSSTYNHWTDTTTAKFYWGTTTYNSRIQNLQYS